MPMLTIFFYYPQRSQGLRATGAGLTLFPNAGRALEALGVAHKLYPLYSPSNKVIITNIPSGATQEISMAGTDKNGGGPRTVHRKALLEALAEELPIDTIRYSSKLSSIEAQKQDDGSSIAILHMDDNTIIKTKVLIGCDGVHSKVARWLGLGEPVSSGRFAVRGLAVFPQGHGFKQEFQQFLGGGIRAGFVPLTDKELYWFLISNQFPPQGIMTIGQPETIRREVIENLAKDFPLVFLDVVKHSDLSSLTSANVTIRLPWQVVFGKISEGTITVAGDAMHPMTPDLGQGGSSSLEDAVVLGRWIGQSVIQNGRLKPKVASKAIENYVKERRWRAAWLITCSFLTGWAQQDGSRWWRKLLRNIFYRFLYKRMFNVMKYDCGKLPKISSFGESLGSTDDTMATRQPQTIRRDVIEKLAKDFPPIFLDFIKHSDLYTLTSADIKIRLPWEIVFGTITVAGDVSRASYDGTKEAA
ncbi:hypothetical protein LguiB_016810 [Lonicera macranthoides]